MIDIYNMNVIYFVCEQLKICLSYFNVSERENVERENCFPFDKERVIYAKCT